MCVCVCVCVCVCIVGWPKSLFLLFCKMTQVVLGLSRWHSGKEFTANAGDKENVGSIPGPGRSHEVGNVYSLQYYCLENPMEREAWLASLQE